MKSWAERFYKGMAWRRVRGAYMKSKHYLCERCGEVAKICHHKTYLTPENINNPELTLSWKNLEALCQDCHNKEHGKTKEITRDDCFFDEYGDLIYKHQGSDLA